MSPEIRIAWDRPNTTGESEHWLSLSLQWLTPDSSTGPVAILVDCSSSMAGGRLTAVRGAVAGLVRELGSERQVSIWSFASETAVVWQGAGGSDVAESLRLLSAGGRTRLDLALTVGMDWIGQRSGDVFVFTDGDPTDAEGKRAEKAPFLEKARGMGRLGIRCSTLGVGNAEQFDTAFVRALADASGGVGFGCSTPEDLPRRARLAVKSRREEQHSVVVELAGDEIRLLEAWRVEPRLHPLACSGQSVTFGASQHGQLLLHVRYRALLGLGLGETVVGEIAVSAGPVVVRETLRLRHVLPSSPDRLALNPSVDQARARVEIARIAEERAASSDLDDQLRLTRRLSDLVVATNDARATRQIGEELRRLAAGELLSADDRSRTVDQLREPHDG